MPRTRTRIEDAPPALLLDNDRLLGLQMARELWRSGVPTLGVSKNHNSHYCRTRAVKRHIDAALFYADPGPTLKSVADSYGKLPVLVPCSDDAVWWLSDNLDAVNGLAHTLIAEASVLDLLSDKGQLYRFAMQHKLPIARTRFILDLQDLDEAVDEIGFPAVLKPRKKSDRWMSLTQGFKVLRFEDASSLRTACSTLLNGEEELILQSWVSGPDASMHALYVCMDRDSQLLFDGIVGRKLRQWPPDIGVGALSQEIHDEEIVTVGVSLLQKLAYVGPGNIQFKRDSNSGELFIIEMNTRYGLGYPLCEACGIDATLIHYCAAAGLALPEARTLRHRGAKWICWKTDLLSAYAHWRRGDLGFGDWLASLRGRKYSADIAVDDPMPQIVDAWRKLSGGFSPRARKTLKG